MANFQYRGLQRDGLVAEGVIEAGGRQEAFRLLEERGLTPLNLAEDESIPQNGQPKSPFHWKRKKVPFSSLESFTRQLSNLLAAGVPLSRALTILSKEAAVPAAAEKWKEVHDLVVDGTSLAEAMGRSPETFPRVYVAMTQAGETGGFLDVVLGQIAEFQSREKELRAKVFAALIYPAVLLCLAISVLIFLLVFFIPRFQTIFSGFGAALPALTQAIVNTSAFVRQYGFLVAVAIVVFYFLVRKWLQTDSGRRQWENLLLALPVIGPLQASFSMARFCRMLGTLISAGVPLINALTVARRSISNQTLVDTVVNSIERVKQGSRLADSLSSCGELFPGSVLEMISVAEETGRLSEELIRLASVTESDLDRRMKMAVALAEPLMLFLIAGFIGIIFVGMVIPIFTIQDYIK